MVPSSSVTEATRSPPQTENDFPPHDVILEGIQQLEQRERQAFLEAHSSRHAASQERHVAGAIQRASNSEGAVASTSNQVSPDKILSKRKMKHLRAEARRASALSSVTVSQEETLICMEDNSAEVMVLYIVQKLVLMIDRARRITSHPPQELELLYIQLMGRVGRCSQQHTAFLRCPRRLGKVL
jgi:hypothetical protein